MWARLVYKFDMLVYKLAFPSLSRLCIRSPGMAYLFELYLRKFREKQELPTSLQEATKKFFEEINSIDTH